MGLSNTQQAKLDKMIEYLTTGHLESFGGYPYDYGIFGKSLVVASLDDAKDRQRTSLDTYKIKDLLAWHDEATALAAEENLGWIDAVIATMPE